MRRVDSPSRFSIFVLKDCINRFLCWAAFVAPGGFSLRPLLHRCRGVRMGRGVWISQLVYLDVLYPRAITLGSNVTIGFRSTIFAHCHWGPFRRQNGFKPVVIEDDVYIGPHCVILAGVRIGKGSVIRAGSVLTRSVPARTFWGGDGGGGPVGKATVPLTVDHEYDDFIKGLRPSQRRVE